MGNYGKAEPLLKEALEIRQKVLGQEHPDTATNLNGLAMLYWVMGDHAKAEPLFKEALEIRRKVLGPEHPDTAQSLNNLAVLYKRMGDYAKAEPLYKEALEIYQKIPWPGASQYSDKPEQSGVFGVGLRKNSGSQTSRPDLGTLPTSKSFPKSFRSAQRTSGSLTSAS